MKLQYGYYVFLGHGDYHKPEKLNSAWISTWKFEDWKIFIEGIAKLGANTLMVYLNGHFFPYQSKAFPELVQTDHPNVENEFFSKVILFAQSCGIQLIAVFTTTGHSGEFCRFNPQLKIKTRPHDVDLDKLLSPFPAHIRKTKNIAKQGNAQIGFGNLCHNNPMAQEYVVKLIREGIELYSQIDGIALHPPESIYPCYCDFCCMHAQKIHGYDLFNVSDEIARGFYLESYMDFQKNILEKEIKQHTTQPLYTFTVPWLFEPMFEAIANKISLDVILIDWDYNLELSRISDLKDRLVRYQQYGHRLWFMPTAGFGITQDQDMEIQLERVQMQMHRAIDAKISGIVHFVGPTCTLDLSKTNLIVSYRIEKIISGGQTGVDRAALDIAIELGIPYGGTCPKGRLDENGVIPEKYIHLQEVKGEFDNEVDNYAARTISNIIDSDGTLIMVPAIPLPKKIKDGTVLTIKEVEKNMKPYLVIDLSEAASANTQLIRNWVANNKIKIINIAGPRESTWPGIYSASLVLLKKAADCITKKKDIVPKSKCSL